MGVLQVGLGGPGQAGRGPAMDVKGFCRSGALLVLCLCNPVNFTSKVQNKCFQGIFNADLDLYCLTFLLWYPGAPVLASCPILGRCHSK